MTKADPIRTCIGCRAKDSRSALVRLVLVRSDLASALVVVDERKCQPGRGAWIHPSPACLDRAVRHRAVARALRVTGSVELGEVSCASSPEQVGTESDLKMDTR